MANDCPCSRAGCYMECEIEKTCWIGSIADSLTNYEPIFVCENGDLQSCDLSPKCEENENETFLLKINKSGKENVKTCLWLSKKGAKKTEKICKNKVIYGSFGPAQTVCQFTCESCGACYENEKSKFYFGKTKEKDVFKTCKWLARKNPEVIEKSCKKTKTKKGYGPAVTVCPSTCGTQGEGLCLK